MKKEDILKEVQALAIPHPAARCERCDEPLLLVDVSGEHAEFAFWKYICGQCKEDRQP
jgi:hypothetical protein